MPAITRSPWVFFTGRDSPVIIDSLTSLAPSCTDAIGRDARAGTDQHQVALLERADRAPPRLSPPVATTRVRCSGSSFASSRERALRLGDGAHLDPVAQEHDRDQRRQLLPQRHARVAQRHGAR